LIFELFIAKRLSKSNLNKNYYSGPINTICTLAIAISIIIMIIATSSGNGLKQAIKNNAINIESHIKITGLYNNNETEFIHLDLDILNTINDVQSIHPIVTKSAIISNENNIEGIILKGIDLSYKQKHIKESIVTGTFFDNNPNELIISTEHANKLNLKVGDKCILYFLSKNNNIQKRKFIITGTYKMANEMLDQFYVFTKKEAIQKINRWDNDKVTSYEITLKKNSNTITTTQKINSILPYDLVAKSIDSQFPGIFNWIKLFDKNISFILIIMSIICIINMSNALLILVIERFKMIGILKSYGASNYKILKIFLYNSFKISINSVLIGNIIGIGICIIQQKTQIIQMDSASYFVNYLPIYLDYNLIIIINILIIIITQLGMILPYYIIQKLSPSNILKIN